MDRRIVKYFIAMALLTLLGWGSAAADLEAYLRAYSLPPLQDDFPKVIAEGKMYTVHRVIEPYFEYLKELGILPEADTFRDDLYVLIVDPETGLPVADIQTLRQALFAYFDAGSLAIGNSSRWREKSTDIFWLSQVKHPLQRGIAGLAQALSSVAGGLTLTLLTGGAGSEIAAAKVMGDLSKAVLSEALGYLLDFTPVEALRRVTFDCLNEAKAAYDAAISLQNRLTYGETLSADEVLTCYHTLNVWELVYNDLVLLDNEIWSGFAYETAGSCVWNATLSFAVSGAGKIKTLTESEIGKAVAQLTEQEKFAVKYFLNYVLKSAVFEDLKVSISTSHGAFTSLGSEKYPLELADFIAKTSVLAQMGYWAPELKAAFDHFEPLLNSMIGAIEETAAHISNLERMRPSKVAFAVQEALSRGPSQAGIAVPPTTHQWTRTYRGPEDDYRGRCVQETSDGGFVVVGTLDNNYWDGSREDIGLIKTDPLGETLWERVFGGVDSDWVMHVEETNDGGYIMVGSTDSYIDDWDDAGDIWLIKTDSEGNKLWDSTFGEDECNTGLMVHQTYDGGFVILGGKWFLNENRDNFTHHDIWLIKTDHHGKKLWDRTFGGPRDDWGSSVQQTKDGGYIIVGDTDSYSNDNGKGDAWLIKTDAQGNVIWDRTFGGLCIDQALSGGETSDGGYIIAGNTSIANTDCKPATWLLRTDAHGDFLWERTFSEFGVWGARHIEQTSDGGFIVLADAFNEDEKTMYVWLFKTDTQGGLVWDKTFGGSEQWIEGRFLKQTGDGGYVIVGEISPRDLSRTDLWLVKTDGQGNVE
jgi:hypothetical protein